jgi:agmatinase
VFLIINQRLNTPQLLEIIQNLKGELVGADIVEYNPERDSFGIAGMVAAIFLKEMASKMLEKKNNLV